MKKKNAVYQLIDCFTLFHFKFLKDIPTDGHFWSNQINTPIVNSWYCKADPDKGIFGSQIDLLIIRKDQVINLCEMKYFGSEYTVTEKVDRSIRNKINDLVLLTGTKYVIYPTLITTYGLVGNSYAENIQSVITLDGLFAM